MIADEVKNDDDVIGIVFSARTIENIQRNSEEVQKLQDIVENKEILKSIQTPLEAAELMNDIARCTIFTRANREPISGQILVLGLPG